MTKPQIWVAATLVLFLLLFVLENNTNRSDEQQKATSNMPPQMGQTAQPQTADELISSLGCKGCHGSDLSGTKMAPDLHNVKDFFSRDKLINYLRNPSSFMSSERFQNFKAKYTGVMMPSFSNIDVKSLGKIADYLLSLKK
jgi:hypothetical protein